MWGKRTDYIVRERVPFNAEPPGEALAGGAITALDTFYCRNHGAFPDIPPKQWRVTVGGMVDMPLTEVRPRTQAVGGEGVVAGTVTGAVVSEPPPRHRMRSRRRSRAIRSSRS